MGIGEGGLGIGEWGIGIGSSEEIFFLNLKKFCIFRFFPLFSVFSKWGKENNEELKTKYSPQY